MKILPDILAAMREDFNAASVLLLKISAGSTIEEERERLTELVQRLSSLGALLWVIELPPLPPQNA